MVRQLNNESISQLYDAILVIKDKDELKKFLEDLCTITELFAISQRLEVARMLRKEKTYLTIADETGASTATISRVNRTLNYGNGMYKEVLNRLKK